jgi:hypothetical protein
MNRSYRGSGSWGADPVAVDGLAVLHVKYESLGDDLVINLDDFDLGIDYRGLAVPWVERLGCGQKNAHRVAS